jgi:hypothetical protein
MSLTNRPQAQALLRGIRALIHEGGEQGPPGVQLDAQEGVLGPVVFARASDCRRAPAP